MLAVRLDIFHALNRISRLMKKGHGGFKAFMARLRDACFEVNLEDIRMVRVAFSCHIVFAILQHLSCCHIFQDFEATPPPAFFSRFHMWCTMSHAS